MWRGLDVEMAPDGELPLTPAPRTTSTGGLEIEDAALSLKIRVRIP
jgi:hypothetical protein